MNRLVSAACKRAATAVTVCKRLKTRNFSTSGQDVHGQTRTRVLAQPFINDYVFPPVIIGVNVLPYKI